MVFFYWRKFLFYPLHLFSYLNSWERASMFPFECSALNNGTTGTIFITSLVWCGPWLGIEPRTSRTRSQHYTTRLSRRRSEPSEKEMSQKVLYANKTNVNALYMYTNCYMKGLKSYLSWLFLVMRSCTSVCLWWQSAISDIRFSLTLPLLSLSRHTPFPAVYKVQSIHVADMVD